jgi:hypothetical protein
MPLETGIRLLDESGVLDEFTLKDWPIVHTWPNEDFFVIEHDKTSLVVDGINVTKRPWNVWQDIVSQTGERPVTLRGARALSYLYTHTLCHEVDLADE